MKEKLIAFVLAGMMVLSLVGCGAQKDKDDNVNAGNGDVSENNGGTTNTGDLGLGVFAVLAVVSLAGVVVAKKVK